MRELTIEELHMVSGGGGRSSGSANHGDMYEELLRMKGPGPWLPGWTGGFTKGGPAPASAPHSISPRGALIGTAVVLTGVANYLPAGAPKAVVAMGAAGAAALGASMPPQ
jgi:hypothetical protein